MIPARPQVDIDSTTPMEAVVDARFLSEAFRSTAGHST
jgi:hypothetical protein